MVLPAEGSMVYGVDELRKHFCIKNERKQERKKKGKKERKKERKELKGKRLKNQKKITRND